jgi:hypothetical protein
MEVAFLYAKTSCLLRTTGFLNRRNAYRYRNLNAVLPELRLIKNKKKNFVRKFRAKFFCTYILGLNFFGAGILTQMRS